MGKANCLAALSSCSDLFSCKGLFLLFVRHNREISYTMYRLAVILLVIILDLLIFMRPIDRHGNTNGEDGIRSRPPITTLASGLAVSEPMPVLMAAGREPIAAMRAVIERADPGFTRS